METLKQFTAVPLFATAIWLAWVYGQLLCRQALGVSQMALLLACFLVLASRRLGAGPMAGAGRGQRDCGGGVDCAGAGDSVVAGERGGAPGELRCSRRTDR